VLHAPAGVPIQYPIVGSGLSPPLDDLVNIVLGHLPMLEGARQINQRGTVED
jgi:hypothetical protein